MRIGGDDITDICMALAEGDIPTMFWGTDCRPDLGPLIKGGMKLLRYKSLVYTFVLIKFDQLFLPFQRLLLHVHGGLFQTIQSCSIEPLVLTQP